MGKKLSIRNKIILGFLVPVFFVILIGFSAYRKAEEGMSGNFQTSTRQTIATATEYVDIACTFISSEGEKYAKNDDMVNYCKGLYANDRAKALNMLTKLKNNLNSSKLSNSFISDIHIVTKPGITAISTGSGGRMDEVLLEAYTKELADEQGLLPVWTDHHDFLDGTLELSQEDYILTYEIYGQSRNSAVVIDVKAEAVREFLASLNLGEGSIVGFVTMNGRELIAENRSDGGTSLTEGEQVFYGQPFFEGIGEENAEGSSQVKYKGKNYLFLYSYSDLTGCTVCALVPMKLVTGQAEGIRSLTIVLVLLACLIVAVVCFLIASGIQGNMQQISGKLGEVAEGDLTVQVRVKGHDEFEKLADSANHMIRNTRKLVNKVNGATDQLEASSREVGEASDIINDYSHNITDAINSINEGISRQAVHARECVDRTDVLSNEIQGVGDVVEKVETLVVETERKLDHAMEIIRVLGDRAEETTRITAQVGESIDALQKESQIINSFAEVITDISEQTNLLSLNASIEAARAGDAGRGFAVVAEEIRKLADSSANAAGEIGNNVVHISEYTMNSVQSAEQAQSMVALQSQAVREVVEVFGQMQELNAGLVKGLKEIVARTEKADVERSEAMTAVQNISAIIEETAESAEKVNEVATRLLQNVENLNRTADVLGDNMEGLKAEISVFKV